MLSGEKLLAVQVRDRAFGILLRELLREWGYAPAAEEAAPLCLEEERGALRLTGGGADSRFPLPLAMEELWVALGSHFHAIPRRYIRLPLRLPIEVAARGQAAASQLISLSEMGGRFHFHRELAVGEEVALQIAVDGGIRLAGRVIYVMGRHEIDGPDAPFEIGAVFDRTERPIRHRLRDLIIAAYLVRLRSRIDPATFAAALARFRLPPGGLEEILA